MNRLLINQIPVTIPNHSVNLYYELLVDKDFKNDLESKKIYYLQDSCNNDDAFLPLLQKALAEGNNFINLTFVPEIADVQKLKPIEVNIFNNKYFCKLYIRQFLQKYFKDKGFILSKNFVGDLEVWEHKESEENFDAYMVWGLKIDDSNNEYLITIGLESENSLIYKKTIRELNLDNTIFTKVMFDNRIIKQKHISKDKLLDTRPMVNFNLGKKLNIRKIKSNFSYMNHFEKIYNFYDKFLKEKEIGGEINILSSGFKEVSDKDMLRLSENKDILEFGDGKFEIDPYRGFSNYGPYKIPDNIDDIKFIFIFHKTDKDLANNLYKYLRYGYRHFPGLESYTKIKFDLDKGKSIIFENKTNPLPEIIDKLNSSDLSGDTKYVALYISPIDEEGATKEERKIYFRVKEELISRNITSQVVESNKFKSQNVHFYLPNVAIAILAKIGGIPWKLKREKENYLLLGFGDSLNPAGGSQYIGNTVCFNNEGIFQNLQCFNYTNDNLKESLEKAINHHIMENGEPKRLIIHYFKDWGTWEDDKLKEIFEKLNIKIPYVVLNINENRARDYICFDNNYIAKTPLNGTIIRLNGKNEFLFFNNDRYTAESTLFKGVDRYPIKVKISASFAVEVLDENEILNLFDQIYQFSKMYWRSVKQISIPVTVEYSKSLSEKVSYFENKELPNTDVARKSLWFI